MAKVMLVEDDAVMADLLNTLLELEGFEVLLQKQAQDFLLNVKNNRPDLILLDVHLRGAGQEQSGFDLLAQIRADADVRNVRVILTSGIDFSDKSKDALADGFILKPYMPNDLISLIKKILS